VLPLFWWIDDLDHVPAAVGLSLAWVACGIVIASLLARELRPGDRFDEAASALIGVFAIGTASLVMQIPTWTRVLEDDGLSGWRSLLAIGAAAVLAITAAVRRSPDRSRLWWLAAAMAMPFVAPPVVPGNPRDMSALAEIFRVILVMVLPLGLLAIEARL